MKNGILKMFALIIFSAAALQGCAIESHRRTGNRRYDRYRHDRNHYDNRYNNRYHYNDRYNN
jgi:hypothetical protein